MQVIKNCSAIQVFCPPTFRLTVMHYFLAFRLGTMLLEIFLTLPIGCLFLLAKLLRKPPRLWKEDGMFIYGPGSRRLGIMESLMGEEGALILSNVIIIRSKCQLTKAIILKALMALSQRHPMLRMRLGKENGEFTYMKEVENFEVDLEECNTKDWQKTVEDQILKIFNTEKGPLWRVKFLPKTSYNDGQQDGYPYQAACVFAFHHAITDGPSYSRLFGEFLTRIHEILDGNEPSVETAPILPPVDAYIDSADIFKPKLNFLINLFGLVASVPALVRFMAKNFEKSPLFVTNLGVETDRNPNALKKTCIIPVELTKEQTSQLLAACKKHKTTVHCAIQTAACVAYCTMADGGSLTQTHEINSGPTCNLRPYLGAEELNDYHGAYFAAVMIDTEVGPELPFWDVVSAVTANLTSQMKAHGPFLLFGFMSSLSKSDTFWEAAKKASESLPGGRNQDLVFTNLGHLKFLNRDENSKVKLSAGFGCSAEQNVGATFANNIATFNGKLFWTFVYYSHVTSKKQAQKYADLTIETLLREIKE